MSKLSERDERLLLQALQESNIVEPNETNQFPGFEGGTTVYWCRDGDDIKLVVNSVYWFDGRMGTSVTLGKLTERATHFFHSDTEALHALRDLLQYLTEYLSSLLPIASRSLYWRSHNLVKAKLSASQLLMLEEVQSAIGEDMEDVDRQLVNMNKHLRAHPSRGGSAAKLDHRERQSLHEQYDRIREIARPIKKDYNATLNTFRNRTGYTWEQWQDFWKKYATDLYGFDEEFLLLFAEHDSPSASEIAYRLLARHHGHSRSYIEQLVLKSRREAGKPKRRKTSQSNA